MKKVLILYKFLPQYRKEFFNRLRVALLQENIELELIYGKIKNSDALKNDEVDLDWALYIENKRILIGKTELLWQPCLQYINNKDLVIVEGANRLLINYYLMIARHFSKYKLAFWGHGRNLQEDINSMRNRFKYLFINKCDWWFGYTKGVKQFLLLNNVSENKITIVQNAIDTLKLKQYYDSFQINEIVELKESLGIKGSKTGIYCGAMYPDKRLDFVLEVCFRIKNEISDFNMIFIGSGIEAFKVIEASRSNDWIHYVGPKFEEERVKYFKISDIQIMPAAVGLGMLDSFAMETPMITTVNSFHGPEIEYLENGVNGFITNDNIDDYTNKVIDVLKTEKYKDLKDSCKISASEYTLEKMVNNFKNGIISCINSSKN